MQSLLLCPQTNGNAPSEPSVMIMGITLLYKNATSENASQVAVHIIVANTSIILVGVASSDLSPKGIDYTYTCILLQIRRNMILSLQQRSLLFVQRFLYKCFVVDSKLRNIQNHLYDTRQIDISFRWLKQEGLP